MIANNMQTILAILVALCLGFATPIMVQDNSQDDTESSDWVEMNDFDVTVIGPGEANGQAPEQNNNMPQMPEQNNNTMPSMPDNGFPNNNQNNNMPQMPEQNNNMPQMPEQNNNTMPSMPDNGFPNNNQNNNTPSMPGQQNNNMPQMPEQNNNTMPSMPGQQDGSSITGTASEAGAIVTSDVINTASDLTADLSNATTITMSNDNNQVKITESGTYIITGTCDDGNIVVKKGTTGVVLILKDLDLTSTTGATVSINKTAEVKIIIEGTVTLTDNEDPADEDSEDADVADAFDGAALKVKDGANVCLTGTGTLNINGNAKNGIKVGDEDTPSFVIDGTLTINIVASNDGINGGYDITILSGTLNISAGDDAIHADRILTISDNGSGPTINVTKSYEGIEATVVNIFGGNGTIVSSDDAINAANSDGTFASLGYSVNITAGNWTIKSGCDGIDSNGNINILGGTVTIICSYNGGDAGIDYDGALFISDDAVVNNSGGVAGPDGMPGQMGGQNGMNMPGQMGGMNGQMGGMNGKMMFA